MPTCISEAANPRLRACAATRQTDDFGQFTLTGIEPGEIVLMVYKPGYELHREKIAYSAPITNKTITLRKSAGVDVRVKPGSRRFPRGFTITQYIPGNDYEIDLWMPLDREGLCHVPSRTGRNHVSHRALQRRAHRHRRMGRSIVRAAMKHRIAIFGLVLLAIGAVLLVRASVELVD